jgi:hypothetical protein
VVKLPFVAYLISRFALIQFNEAEFTDGYQLLTWSLDHPTRWHPLYPLLIKPFAVIVDPVIAGRLISIASGFLAMLVLSRIAARVYGQRSATVMAWLYTASPLFFWCNIRVLTESTFQLLFCFSALLFLLSLNNDRPHVPAAFIFVSGLSALTRPEGFILLPAVAYVLYQQVIQKPRNRRMVLSVAALFSWFLCLVWSFLISSSDSYSNIFVTNMSEFQWGHAFHRLTSYIEVYPYILFYPFFVYALFNIVTHERRPFGFAAWKYLLLYVHVAFAVLLFFHPAWTTRFLLIPVSLLLVEASAGLVNSRVAVKTALVACCFSFAFLAIYLQKGMFADFKTSAIAIKKISGEHRVISDEQAKTDYYLGKPVISYESNLELQTGDLLILHSYNTDLNREKEFLDGRYVYQALVSTETSILPLLANSALGEIQYSNSPVALLQRFHQQRFQSVVLKIDRPKSSPKNP